MADEFGGIAVDEPSTDEFGGIAVEEPVQSPQAPEPAVNLQRYVAGGGPMAGMAMLPEAPDIPRIEGESTLGKIGAAAVNLPASIYNAAKSPLGLTAAVAAPASPIIGTAMGLGFGLPAIYQGLKEIYKYGAGVGELQSALEGAGQTGMGAAMAIPAGLQAAKLVPRIKVSIPENVPRGTSEPILSPVKRVQVVEESLFPWITDEQKSVWNALPENVKARAAFLGITSRNFDGVIAKAESDLAPKPEPLPRPTALPTHPEAAAQKKQDEAVPSGVSGEPPPTAPATVEAKAGEVAPSPAGPAITEPKPVEPVGQATSVTPPVTKAPTTSGETAPGSKPISEGPGAASPGDVPTQSTLNQLSQQIQAQGLTSPNVPIFERISNALGIADRWAKKKDSLTQGLAKTRAASQALIDSYVSQPKWTDFISSIGKWVGADQKTALEVRDFQRRIVKAIPNRLRQEAITNWIQANGDEALLRDRAQASKPAVRKGYELALTLSEGEKNIARNIQSYLESRLDEGLKAGLLKQGVDNYVTQVWKRPTTATQKMWADLFGVGSLNPNFRYAKQRIFDSYFDGEQAGYTPKNKTIGNLVSVYDLAFNRALSARGLIKELQTGKASDGMPITMTSGKTSAIAGDNNIPEAFLIKPNTPPTGAVTADGRPYRPIDHWALRDWKWATKGPEGQPVFVQGDMLVHPDHWDHLNNVLKHSRLQSNPVTGTILRASALAKQTKLSLSPFHTVQEAVHSAAHRVNPFNPTEINLNDPVQKGLVDHGLMIQDPRSEELFAEGASGGGLIGKIPGLGHLQQWYTEMTFKDYIPKLKMNMALDALERNRKAYAGKLSDDQIQALTARESNAAFGEQNYRMMGRSPNVQDFLRLVLLAPDFLEARARFIGQALKPYGREQRIALGLMAASLYTAARIINKASDDDYHWDKPFSVFANGKEYRLRTLLGDAQHLVTDPRSFWYNRLSPISRTVSEYITGRDDRGIKRSSMEQLADFASWFKPIPFQIRSDQTLKDAILASTGIPSKRYSKQQEVYEIADQWMKNNPDPKVKERYDRIRQETLPDSPYRPLRDALNKDDLKAARKEYDKLRQTRSQSLIHQSMRHSRPFTGSLSTDIKFKNSLTPEQLKTYNLAIRERQDQYQKFLRAINQ